MRAGHWRSFIPTAMDMPDIAVEIVTLLEVRQSMSEPAPRDLEGAEMEFSGRPADIVVNQSSVSHIPGVEPDRHALEVHRRLPAYQVTPLLDCPALAASLGVGQVWVKDESRRLGLPSFKMLGA